MGVYKYECALGWRCDGPMPAQVADDMVSTMLRTLGDPVRLRLLRELPAENAAEVPVGELARRLDVSDTVVSQHLRVLTGLGLVGHRRNGRAQPITT